MDQPTLSDRILLRANALEAWLERTRSQHRLLPARLGGYGVLLGLLMLSNTFALFRWPVASVLGRFQAAGKTIPASPDGETSAQPVVHEPVAVDSDGLEALIRGGKPVLVDFWAVWCGPCMLMNDSLHRVARDLEKVCRVAKVDTMEHQAVAAAYGVRGLPTLILFNEGEEVERHAGALSYPELRSWIERHVPVRVDSSGTGV